MIQSIFIGMFTAIIFFIPRYVYSVVPSVHLAHPLLILGVGAVGLFLQKWMVERHSQGSHYGGLSDLFFQVHNPLGFQTTIGQSIKWMIRGLISLLFACCGGIAGPEGSAIEMTNAIHLRWGNYYSRWFEQKRRTDVSSCLAGGLSAAFGAPLAGILFPIELGLGGRSLSSAVSALTAFLLSQYLLNQLSVSSLDVNGVLSTFYLDRWHQWVGVLTIGVCAGIMAAGTVHFVRYTQESFKSFFQTKMWMRMLIGTILLALVVSMDRHLRDESWRILEQLLWLKYAPEQVLFLLFTQLITVVILLASFGTVGVVWPLFVIGGAIGCCVDHWVLKDLLDFVAIAGLSGGAAYCGAVLGVPLTASVLVYEMTQNIQMLLPCLIAAWIAQKCRGWLWAKSLTEQELWSRGLVLVNGKSLQILNSMRVRDTMATDFEWIHDDALVAELKEKVLQSRYPFLPIVSPRGLFKGLLSIDLFQEAWAEQEKMSASERLSQVLEVKDLLYRVGNKNPVIHADDCVAQVIDLFESVPCLPVVGEDNHILGILLLYHVRLAYDREVVKSAFAFMGDGSQVFR